MLNLFNDSDTFPFLCKPIGRFYQIYIVSDLHMKVRSSIILAIISNVYLSTCVLSEWMLLMVDYCVCLNTIFIWNYPILLPLSAPFMLIQLEFRASFDQKHEFETFKYQPISFQWFNLFIVYISKAKKINRINRYVTWYVSLLIKWKMKKKRTWIAKNVH